MGILEFAFIALSLFYIVTAIYSMIRIIKVSLSEIAIKVSISFYTGMFIASVARAISLYLISINILTSNDETNALNIFIYLMIIVPDMINICVYLFLIWYFYANFILSHINLANDLSLFSKDDVPTISGKTYTMLYIMIPIYMLTFVVVCLLTFTNDISRFVLYEINSCFSLVTPILFLVYFIFLLVKFSGRPYINEKMKNQIKKIFVIVCIWSIARLVTGILGLMVSGSFINSIFTDFEEKSNNTIYSVTILVYFIVSEYIPNFFALDYTLMTTYIKQEKILDEEEREVTLNVQDVKSSSTPIESRKVSLNADGVAYVNSPTNIQTKPFRGTTLLNNNSNNLIPGLRRNINDFMIKKFNDIQLIQMLFQRKNGLGNIFKASYQGIYVSCRVVKFDRLSRYDLEGLSKDIEDLINLNHPNVSPLTGICVENLPNIFILWPYCNNGSLYDVLHNQKTQSPMNLKTRMNIAKQIASGLQYLHENRIYHYHLSSRNIYLDDELTPLIADYGLHCLKDISSVFIKYKNKNSYSSPEILKDSSKVIGSGNAYINGNTNLNVISNANSANSNNSNNSADLYAKSDIYSFGILLWELYTCTIPFNVSLNMVYDYVVVNGYRPEITNDFNPEIASLIRLCLDEDAAKRPNFKTILEILEICKL